MSENLILDCSSEKSGDLYGLGVRIGIYCVWLTSWLANNYVPDEISGALDANSIFLLALISALIRGTFANGADRLRYIDGLILMQLCSGYIFGCFSIWGYRAVWHKQDGRKGIRHFGGFGTHCRLVLCTIISAYGCWFWIQGVEYGLAWITNEDGSKREECYPLMTFFFVKLPIMDDVGIRIWYIFITICTTVYFGLMLLVATAHRFAEAWKTKRILARGKGIYVTGLTDTELRYVFLFCRWCNLAWIFFVMVKVEMTLNWNHVSQVVGPTGNIATPAQLLPLLVGSLGLVRMLYIIFRERLEEHEGNAKGATNTDLEPQSSSGVAEDANFDIASHTTAVRYLIAWLPWLSLTSLWTNLPPGTGRRSLRHRSYRQLNGPKQYDDVELEHSSQTLRPHGSVSKEEDISSLQSVPEGS